VVNTVSLSVSAGFRSLLLVIYIFIITITLTKVMSLVLTNIFGR